MTYADFLARKVREHGSYGTDVLPGEIHPMLHDWQAELVRWAAQVGRCAIWADTGLGKTVMQLEWARLVGTRSLVIAPLAVCAQTVREAAKLGIPAAYAKTDTEAPGPGVWVTNYERVKDFDPTGFDAVVLDEASILKQSDGKTRTALIAWASQVARRLACTATPAPNDVEELTSQAEWVGAMSRVNMLAAYFVHDSDDGWRLKGHARRPMLRWMGSWAVALRRPSDLGYQDDGYILPGLEIVSHTIPAPELTPHDQLFATDLGGVGGRARVRRGTLDRRVEKTLELLRDCGSHGVLAGVLPSQQGEVGSDAGGQRTQERTAQGEVCGRCCDAGGCDCLSQRVPAQEPAGTASLDLRAEPPRDRADAGSGLRGLSRATGEGFDRSAAHRSRPHDGHGPGCSLSALQPGARALAGRPGEDRPTDGVPACRDQWLIWCGLNDEQNALAAALGDECVSIQGSDDLDQKIELERRWREGEVRVLVTKPSVFMYGMNWQHCARMAFVGLSDSYETYYQAIRRCYRYGQTRRVHAHIVLSDLEGQIAANVARKERQATSVLDDLVREMRAAREFVGMTGDVYADGNPWPLACIRCDRDCTDDPYHLTHNDGTTDGQACFACAAYLNGASR